MEKYSKSLISIIRNYCFKRNSGIVETDALVRFLQAAAKKKSNLSGIELWEGDTENKVSAALEILADENKIKLLRGDAKKFYLLSFYYDKINYAYSHYVTGSIENPFPDSNGLNFFEMPESAARNINLRTGFSDYLNEKDKDEDEILCIEFEGDYGIMFVLPHILPEKIMELALLKIRDYLAHYGSNDYRRQRIVSNFTGREQSAKENYKIIETDIPKAQELIIAGNENTFSFWMYLCAILKDEIDEDIERNMEKQPRDTALFQSINIIAACNNYYRIIFLNARKKEQAFSKIDEKMGEAPYYFTTEEISSFQGVPGQRVLANYTNADLKTYIEGRLLPESSGLFQLLEFHGKNKEAWYVRKDKLITLCKGLINDLMPLLKMRVINRWLDILREYHTEPAMRDNKAFEELIVDLTEVATPHLIPIIRDTRVGYLLEDTKTGNAKLSVELFNRGEPVELRRITGLQKEALLLAARAQLPFWYSIGIIVKIIGFFKHGKNRDIIQKPKTQTNSKKEKKKDAAAAKDSVPKKNIKAIDAELDALAREWNQHLDFAAQTKFRDDINAIIKGEFSFMKHSLKLGAMNQSALENIADGLMSSNKTLMDINAKKPLREYIILYMTKLLRSGR